MSAADNASLIRSRLQDSIDNKLEMLNSPCIAQAAEVATMIITALRGGGKVIFFGNGGSAMDAGHLAAELLGRFYYDRPSLASISLSDATAAMTAIGNDYSYEEVFSRQVQGLGARGDVLVGLTTSGNSRNVVKALELGRELGMTTVALTGRHGGAVVAVADVCIRVPSSDTPRVQESCMHLGHSICELVESAMFPRAASSV